MDDNEKIVTMHFCSTLEIDEVDPPSDDFKFPFKTIKEWLIHICTDELPNKVIDTYNFGLFEGHNIYTLFLNGTNTYRISPDHTQIRTEFSPANMYFSLPESEYSGLNREQVLAYITSKLIEFRKTKTYKNSFFKDARKINIEWNGDIWSK